MCFCCHKNKLALRPMVAKKFKNEKDVYQIPLFNLRKETA